MINKKKIKRSNQKSFNTFCCVKQKRKLQVTHSTFFKALLESKFLGMLSLMCCFMIMRKCMPSVYRNQESQEADQQNGRNNPHHRFTHEAKIN